MRSYQIQEISSPDMSRIMDAVRQQAYKSPVDGLFWFVLSNDLLTPVQKEHIGSCGPFYMALETGDSWIRLELLVRCEQRIRCDCIAYASPDQREHMIEFLDQLVRNQDVRV